MSEGESDEGCKQHFERREMVKRAVGGRGRRWNHKAECGKMTVNLSLDTEFGELDGVENLIACAEVYLIKEELMLDEEVLSVLTISTVLGSTI